MQRTITKVLNLFSTCQRGLFTPRAHQRIESVQQCWSLEHNYVHARVPAFAPTFTVLPLPLTRSRSLCLIVCCWLYAALQAARILWLSFAFCVIFFSCCCNWYFNTFQHRPQLASTAGPIYWYIQSKLTNWLWELVLQFVGFCDMQFVTTVSLPFAFVAGTARMNLCLR
jgi:hypothetical protein